MACSVAPAMARSGGVRSCRASTPVPSASAGVAVATAPNVANASGPLTSAVQNEVYPRDSAWRATSTAAAGPRACSDASVPPMGVEDAAGDGAVEDAAGDGAIEDAAGDEVIVGG